jgi:YD repeat-containing protein
VSYSYNSAGQVASVTYPIAVPFDPQWPNPLPGPVTFTYGYDTMGRPVSLTDNGGTSVGYYSGNWSSGPANWVQNVQYDLSNRITSMQVINEVSP